MAVQSSERSGQFGGTEGELGFDHETVETAHAVAESVEGVHAVVEVVVLAEQVLAVDDVVGRHLLSRQAEHLARVRDQRPGAAADQLAVVSREVFVLQEEVQLVLRDACELRFRLSQQ